MFKVLNCLAYEHDWRLVALAATLCTLSGFVALQLLQRAKKTEGIARAIWVVTGGAIGGFGIWSTHFVAMLAYNPGVTFGFETRLTLLSLAMAIGTTSAALALNAYSSDRMSVFLGGILFGLGVSAMHFMGMRAIEFAGHFEWQSYLVVTANTLAVTFAVPAFYVLSHLQGRYRPVLFATALFTLAIIGMHFTGMGAVTVVPGSVQSSTGDLISPFVLVVTITAVALSMLFSGLTAAIFAVRAEKVAEAGEEKLRFLFQGVRDYAIYMLDIDGKVSTWNLGAERTKGYSEQEIVGESFARFYTEEEQQAGIPKRNLETARADGKFEGEGWRVRKDGSLIWVHMSLDAIYDEKQKLIGYAKITRDQTERMLSDKKLQSTANELNLALTHMANALCLFDGAGKLVMHNRRLTEILGITAEKDLRGMTLGEICELNPANAQGRLSAYQKLIDQQHGETITELASGRIIRTTYMPTSTEAWVLTVEDVTERILSERRIAHMARHDALTGLPNRRQFIETLDSRIRTADSLGTQVAVINIDLDRFKDINDTYGHAAGDEVLCTLSERIRKELKDDEDVGRFGGDEFVAMKAFTSLPQLQDFIGRLRKALTEKITLAMTDILPGGSLGVSVYPTDAKDREKLLSC